MSNGGGQTRLDLGSPGSRVKPNATRSTGARTILVLCDQAVASASNFVLAVAVGRWLGPHDLGSLALVLATWLIVYGLFRGLIEDPLAIFADQITVGAALSAGLMLAVGASAVVCVLSLALRGHVPGVQAGLVLSAVLPPVLIQDFWRRVAFLQQRPLAALANDGAYLVIELAALTLGREAFGFSLTAAILCWGCGAVAGVVLGFRQFAIGPEPLRRGINMLNRSRSVSVWIGLDFVVNRSARQLYLFLLAALVGAKTLGGIQASNNLLSFTNILILGAGSVALADGAVRMQAAGNLAMRRAVTVISTLASVLVIVCVGAFVAFSGPILTRLYGSSFRPYITLAPLVALQVVVGCLELLPTTELRLIKETRLMFKTRLMFVPIGLATVWPLCAYWGARGAAAAGVVVAGSLSMGAWVALAAARRRRQAAPCRTEASAVAQ